MKHFVVVLLVLAACARHPPPEPEIVTREVYVNVPVACPALADLGPEPEYSDTDKAIAEVPKGDIAGLAKLYAKGRLERLKRLAAYYAAKASCVF